MAQRTATITWLRYSKKNSRGDAKWKDLAALPDGGDFLTFAMGVWNGLDRRTLRDREKQRYCEPSTHIARGRTLTLSAMAGVYGDPGSVRDVESGEEHLSHDGDLTNATTLRVALFVPARGTSALMTIEHVPGLAFGGRYLDHLKLCWSQVYPEWTLNTSTLTRPEAWLRNAELEAVTAEIFNHRANLEDAGQPTSMGVLKAVLEPKKGTRYFPHSVLAGLQEKTISSAALLGLPEEPDQVKLTLGDGEQHKTFVLGKDKTPTIRQLVTDYGEPALTDDAFRTWSAAEVAPHFKTVGADWDASMIGGEWSQEALATKVRFVDGR